MHAIWVLVSACLYCASSVVGSEVWLSRTEPYVRYAGQPSEQPFASASLVLVDGPCSSSTYMFVVGGLVTLARLNRPLMLACSKVSGARLYTCCWPICAPVAPSFSVAMSWVEENCEALTTPRLLR